jgi:hypothetical protein
MTLLAPRDAGKILGVSTSRVIQLARLRLLRELRDSANRRYFLLEDVERVARAREKVRRSAKRRVARGTKGDDRWPMN